MTDTVEFDTTSPEFLAAVADAQAQIVKINRRSLRATVAVLAGAAVGITAIVIAATQNEK